MKIQEDDSLVSFDVVNLFGSVPAKEAAELVIERLKEDDGLSLRTTCLVSLWRSW